MRALRPFLVVPVLLVASHLVTATPGPAAGAPATTLSGVSTATTPKRTFTYRIAFKGTIRADRATFRRQVAGTFADDRGWRAAGIGFRRVDRGGDFTVWLAEASTVPTFSSACSAQWSCRVGRDVIINQARWLHATRSWNAAGLTRRGYRHLVVNHETGHWLGHGHEGCGGVGERAPVMMQQSIRLDGCRFNPWPLRRERWTSR